MFISCIHLELRKDFGKSRYGVMALIGKGGTAAYLGDHVCRLFSYIAYTVRGFIYRSINN